MSELFFKCTLLSDIVLNSKLATEGNMTSMNYIPGSNFLGIVASKLYNKLTPEDAKTLFHTGEVSFGDALISKDNEMFYALPLSLFIEKGKDIAIENRMYQHHYLNSSNWPLINGSRVQLKQLRAGFVNAKGEILSSIEKKFSLKSAFDSEERRSKDGAMFGFESILRGQEFIFSVKFESDKFCEFIIDALVGNNRIGKSKSAEFGQVMIEHLPHPAIKAGTEDTEEYTLVYAQSNLCFIDSNGQQTLQPTGEQLGIKDSEVDWAKSQVRTYSYSPWNGRRGTPDTQRHCVAMGSVFYLNKGYKGGEASVGDYKAEGLGRVIYNPLFLNGNVATGETSIFNYIKKNTSVDNYTNSSKPITELGMYLLSRRDGKKRELDISSNIQGAVNTSSNSLKRISPSQWNGIRTIAVNEGDIEKLSEKLFSAEYGFLTHGVAEEKYWGKQKGKLRKEFEEIFKKNKEYGTVFVAKYAAEMAKIAQQKKEIHNGK